MGVETSVQGQLMYMYGKFMMAVLMGYHLQQE